MGAPDVIPGHASWDGAAFGFGEGDALAGVANERFVKGGVAWMGHELNEAATDHDVTGEEGRGHV